MLSDTGTVNADMGPDVKVERAGLVTLRTLRNFDSVKANAKGGALGSLAGGAAVANITIDGSAGATVAGSTIGAASGSLVRDLVVQARFSADATADTIPVSGAIGAGVGNVAVVTLNLTVSAIAEASMATASLALPVIDCRRRVHSDRPCDWRRPRLWRCPNGRKQRDGNDHGHERFLAAEWDQRFSPQRLSHCSFQSRRGCERAGQCWRLADRRHVGHQHRDRYHDDASANP